MLMVTRLPLDPFQCATNLERVNFCCYSVYNRNIGAGIHKTVRPRVDPSIGRLIFRSPNSLNRNLDKPPKPRKAGSPLRSYKLSHSKGTSSGAEKAALHRPGFDFALRIQLSSEKDPLSRYFSPPRIRGSPDSELPMTTTLVLGLSANFMVASIPFHRRSLSVSPWVMIR